jgi:hypothetical protein
MSLLLLLKSSAAVATTNDLRSAIAHLRPYSAIQPIPGSNAQERRQLSGWLYTGIPAAGGAAITITQGTSEALVIAEQAGTVSLSIPVTQGSAEALVLAELGGTVTLNNDTTLAQGTAETLVLAELAGTVSLSMPIVQSAAEALVLDEPTGTVSLVSSAIDIVQGTTTALAITEQGGTITLGGTRPLGLSPWVEFAPTEPADDRQARIRAQRERMGILEVVEKFDAQEASRAIPAINRRDKPKRTEQPGATPAPSSQNGTGDVLSLQAAREAQADRARLLAVLEAMEARKQIEIRRRMALLLLAAEA